MNAVERRKRIAEIIGASQDPVTGSELAAMLLVTRQVVVQDIALLKAGGLQVIATPSGYMMIDTAVRGRPVRVFTCRHTSLEQAEQELKAIVECGGTVRDVIIEHPVYGEISGSLMLYTKKAVECLIDRLRRKDSQMLSCVTDGIHMHTVEADSEGTLNTIEEKLQAAGILLQP
ncbi:MAG: transcription repressor NadR [Bacillota bacterium]